MAAQGFDPFADMSGPRWLDMKPYDRYKTYGLLYKKEMAKNVADSWSFVPTGKTSERKGVKVSQSLEDRANAVARKRAAKAAKIVKEKNSKARAAEKKVKKDRRAKIVEKAKKDAEKKREKDAKYAKA